MLIDWITAAIPVKQLSAEDRYKLNANKEIVMRFKPSTGEELWSKNCWLLVGEDEKSIIYSVTNEKLWIKGSPTRCEEYGCNVFGGVTTRSLNIGKCLQLMIQHVRDHLNIALPDADCSEWRITRVDTTENLEFPNLFEVGSALRFLECAATGRHKTSRFDDSVYWNKGSHLRSAIAYAKGPELRKSSRDLCKRGSSPSYSSLQLRLADNILRLEYRLCREYFRRNDWRSVTPQNLAKQHKDFFFGKLGTPNMEQQNILPRLRSVASERAANVACGILTVIQCKGFDQAKQLFPKPTWARHIKLLKQIGLGEADMRAGSVQPFRQAPLNYRVVQCWEEMSRANCG